MIHYELGTSRYEDAGRDERERAADWNDHVRHWARERQDTLTRDMGENTYTVWPTHVERVRDAGYDLADPKGGSVR